MSYSFIRNSCIFSLVVLIVSLGLMSYIVADRVSRYDSRIAENLMFMSEVRALKDSLQQNTEQIEKVLGKQAEAEGRQILTNFNTLLVAVGTFQTSGNSDVLIHQQQELQEFHDRLRLLKAMFFHYLKEVQYDPSADTTLGLEDLIIEVERNADTLFMQIDEEIITHILELQEELSRYVERTRVLLMSALSIGILLGIVLAITLTRALSVPVQKLIRGTEELAKENFNYTIPISSKDEMGRLAESFNAMIAALREKEAMKVRLHLTQFSVDNASDATFWLDSGGQVIYVNHSACEILEYTREEILQFGIFTIDPGFDATGWQEMWAEVQQHKHAKFESAFLSQSGTAVPVDISVDYISHENHEYLCLLARDTSERREAQRITNELEQRLVRAEKMEAIGTLAGGVAHDLNNILSGIVNYPELMLLDMTKEDPLYGPLVTMRKSGEKAASIVQDLLTLSRRGVTVREVVHLNGIVLGYLESPEFHKLIEYHPEVRIDTRLAADLGNIEGSPVHIEKTVMNLISNSAESMANGGEIQIVTENCHVDEALKGYEDVPQGYYVLLSITDSGIGMNDEELDKIFEPFYTKKVMGRSGSGLGMAVVWGTVKDHNGHINLQSSPGEGTSINIYFPAVSKQLTLSDDDRTSIEQYHGSGEHVLVVDDVKEQRQVAQAMLQQLAYRTEAVASGEEALEWLQQHSTDVVLLDMIMDPGMDGLATFLAMREKQPTIATVIASGFSETQKVEQAQSAGAGQYLRKPYSLQKLGEAIRGAIARVG